MPPSILRVAHRGGAGYAPENTLAAIEKGISLGADFVEIDVQQTKDKQLVVMHDKRVDRTTNGTGRVADLSLAEVRAMHGGEGQVIPLFREVLEAVNGRVGLVAEIITPGIADVTVAEVLSAQLRTEIIYASFLHKEIVRVRELVPEAKTLALWEGVPVSGAQFAADALATHVGLGFDSVTRELVNELHSRHVLVFVYTLNDARDIAHARTMGVDGIVSDYPDRI